MRKELRVIIFVCWTKGYHFRLFFFREGDVKLTLFSLCGVVLHL